MASDVKSSVLWDACHSVMHMGTNVSEETAVSETVGLNCNTPCVISHKSVAFMLSSCNIILNSTNKSTATKTLRFPEEVQPQH
jgi:hypothetical protein